MTNEQKSSQLYRVAYQCAENRSTGRCKPENYCGNCPLNVSLYLADQREAVLIKTNAALDYGKVRAERQSEVVKWLTIIALIIAGIMWLSSSVESCTAPRERPRDTVTRQATFGDVPTTIARVSNTVRDINGDNLINCIDYSLQFYKLFPGECRIIVNRNSGTGMHHMFIQAWIGGKWIDIEPQGPQFDYDMKKVWGDKYNPYYNAIVTEGWLHYLR